MKNKFAQRLSAVRKKSGMSQKTAASKLGISQALLSHYEKGIRECGLDFVLSASKVFGVSTDYLLGLTDRLPTDSPDAEIYEELAKKPKLYLGRNKLQNTTDLLYSITARFGNPKMYTDLNNMLNSNLYLALRMLNDASNASATDSDLFSLPYNTAAFHALSLQSLSYQRFMSKLSEQEINFKLSREWLKKEFPLNFDSAVSIIESVENIKAKDSNAK